MEGGNSDEAESLSERFSASLTERRNRPRNATESQKTIDPLPPREWSYLNLSDQYLAGKRELIIM